MQEQKKEFSLKWKNNVWEGYSDSFDILKAFGSPTQGRSFLIKKNWEENRMKKFYGEMWRNTV